MSKNSSAISSSGAPRRQAWPGHNAWLWPGLPLILAVTVSAACLIWMTDRAVRNERLAARKRLETHHQEQLAAIERRIDSEWERQAARLDDRAELAAPERFAALIADQRLDSLLLYDDGRLAYPTRSGWELAAPPVAEEIRAIEQLEPGDTESAEQAFAACAGSQTDLATAALAWQGRLRCLLRLGRHEQATSLVDAAAGVHPLSHATDPWGRHILANAELAVLQTIGRNDSRFSSLATRLGDRLADYRAPIMAPQRLFLMRELTSLAGGGQTDGHSRAGSGEAARRDFPTLTAESLAAERLELETEQSRDIEADPAVGNPPAVGPRGWRRSPLPGVWERPSPSGSALAMLREATLRRRLREMLGTLAIPSEAEIAFLLPEESGGQTNLISVAAGPQLPGWRLAMDVATETPLDSAALMRSRLPLAASISAILALLVATVFAFSWIQRRTHEAWLRSDLAAAVSHELRTPLASMRLLVDTLLDNAAENSATDGGPLPPVAREYLQLIAKENARLSRLIENFLTFSRLERGPRSRSSTQLDLAQIVREAAATMRERFADPDCELRLEIPERLPAVLGDAAALQTAVVNLLDNAHKYTGPRKIVIVQAAATRSHVRVDVRDNGIGIPNHEASRIFDRFYRVRLGPASERGGCGLGLNIVQRIAAAHRGTVELTSRVGEGSTFSLVLPAFESDDTTFGVAAGSTTDRALGDDATWPRASPAAEA